MSEAPGRRASPPFVIGLLGSALAGCGGGLPLLHPARALPAGSVRATGGFSANVAVGGLADAVRGATNEVTANAGAAGTDSAYAQGALVAASIAPGLAPVVAARVGLGQGFEGGVAYSGRAVRADVRRSFDLSLHWALSAGAGGTAAVAGRQQGIALPNVDVAALHGWGADVPLLVGYESDGQLYSVWLGARAGWEHVDISAAGAGPATLSATRFWGGGLLGLAVGFRHVHVALELDASYAHIAGDYGGLHTSVQGATLSPASAVWWAF